MLKIDCFDKSLLGWAMVWRGNEQVDVLIYDGNKMVKEMMKSNPKNCSEDDAREYINFNIEGAYVGKHTPIIVWSDFNHLHDD